MAEESGHLVPLGSSGWDLWRDIIVRSAGFPARQVLQLADAELAAAADAALQGTSPLGDYEKSFDAAAERLTAAIRRTAGDPRFREAVTWQNRSVAGNCLDKAVAGEPRHVRGRKHEQVIARYLQRYTVKNDTIGFFGPVGWGSWTDDTERVSVTTGDRPLSRRTVYFESWAIDTLARTFSADPEVLPWLAPRAVPANLVEGRTVHRPRTGQVQLSVAEALLLGRCDGSQTVRDLAEELARTDLPELRTEAEVAACLVRWQSEGLVTLGLEGPVEAWPEETLRRKLERIGAPAVRERLLSVLDGLVSARALVSDAAGDEQKLTAAVDGLNTAFADATGAEAVRRHGEMYAGRTLVYEDTVLETRVGLGKPLRDELAAPLGLLLDSARWLVARVADEYRDLFAEKHRKWSARSGEAAMPLSTMLGMATPYLFYSANILPVPVRAATQEFQRRWGGVLGDPTVGARRRTLTSEQLAARIREEFPPVRPQWAGAVHHSPDLMLAAASPEAINSGDYLAVLGELHLAFNPFEARLFVAQHEDPERLHAADAADHGDRRIYLVPPKDWTTITSRLTPPSALLSPQYTYWSLRSESVEAPGPTVALADLFVHEESGRLLVRSKSHSFEADLLEMLGELISAASVNAFKPLKSANHQPRVTIDKLVIARESWTFSPEDVDWAALRSEKERFLAARDWRAEHGIPNRAFYKSPTEIKPVLVDFDSITLVNMLAKVIRTTASVSDATFSVVEMVPDVEEAWFKDRNGVGYTAELRLVAVDPLRD
ncbi:lantibiotic dehydratase [Streptomyces diastaticus]|uniref:lantibiotic dehydratase n=1 Tax=Streptomyces diastaticus TaxID=1956 RepID=UPI003667DC36